MTSTIPPYKSHVERTADEPREPGLHSVILESVIHGNKDVRILRLVPVGKGVIESQPGQWVDLHIPTIAKPGGFTITSPPSSLTSAHPYLELAIQRSPSNPAAAWLFRPVDEIHKQTLQVRVGGSFIWPPKSISPPDIKRVVFVAGGVGMNPFISMLACISEHPVDFDIVVLYTTKFPESGNLDEIIWLQRVMMILKGVGGTLKLFLTNQQPSKIEAKGMQWHNRRLDSNDIEEALGNMPDRNRTVVYICGPSTMTDIFVDIAKQAHGMLEFNVLCEKWW